MTPYEIASTLHRELSPMAPRLSAALNRALTSLGEGSILITSDPPEASSFQESERITLTDGDATQTLSTIVSTLQILEKYSNWRVIIDKKPSTDPQTLELLYTLFREPRG